ncbi:hypothetical protein DLM76_17935 [Leptospira yasudae]|nr:hypothetical protein DLM76_17935 [Leptospira yasudae]
MGSSGNFPYHKIPLLTTAKLPRVGCRTYDSDPEYSLTIGSRFDWTPVQTQFPRRTFDRNDSPPSSPKNA